MGAERYPYDPRARMDELDGLDRLRAIEDRAMAASLFEVWQAIERNERDPQRAARDRQAAAQKERDRLRTLAHAAIVGRYGTKPKELAQHLLFDDRGQRREDTRSLEEFERAFTELRRQRRPERTE